MDLESALKLLAEGEPGKFQWWTDECENFCWDDKACCPKFMTQDDLDEIAALLGYAYEVTWLETGGIDLDDWHCAYWTLPKGSKNKTHVPYHNYDSHTKLEAAKAALIAIIESQYPNKGKVERWKQEPANGCQ